jgi:predicted helicase
MHNIFPDNTIIALSGLQSSKNYSVLASNEIVSLDYIEKTQCLPLYRYESGKRVDNITDWALAEFRSHYGDNSITKEDIFHYVYGVLHNPVYRRKYEIDLKQDYPRVPYYENFARWRDWGKELMELHIGFETVSAYPGIEIVLAPAKAKETKTHSAGYSKDDNGNRVFDGTVTFCDGSGLKGIPMEAFDYRLGNKSAIEWILDQYVAPSYPTDEEVLSGKRKIREDERVLRDNFNTFRFADYKDKVIDLIRRVTTVSIKTVGLQKEMEKTEG